MRTFRPFAAPVPKVCFVVAKRKLVVRETLSKDMRFLETTSKNFNE